MICKSSRVIFYLRVISFFFQDKLEELRKKEKLRERHAKKFLFDCYFFYFEQIINNKIQIVKIFLFHVSTENRVNY